MNLSFDIKELNSLYLAVSNQLKQAQADYKQYPSHFFHTELVTTQKLVDRVQDALYAEIKRFDESMAELSK